MCQTVSEQGRQDVYCVPLHDSDLLSGDGTHGTGDLSLVVETGTPFLLVEGRRSRGILNWIGMDWEIPKEPMWLYALHLFKSTCRI